MPLRGQCSTSLATLLTPLLDLCEEAAAAIRHEYLVAIPTAVDERSGADEVTGEDLSEAVGLLRRKADHSPLTAADLASHQVLARGLADLTPDIPLLSEESPPGEVMHRHSWQRLWLVDPLDGTREFLERSGQFTINVALVEAGRPSLGVIYEPLAREASVGVVGEGAWRVALHDGSWQRTPLATRNLPDDEIIVLSSRRHGNDRLAVSLAFLEVRGRIDRRNSGSALKFSDLAAGAGDVYPRFSACSEWDVAAGDALVTAAGGAVWGLDGEPLLYNARDSLLSPHFVAVGDPGAALWSELLDALA